MRVIQVLPVLAFGDAVGNDARALKNVLKNAGYNTQIYAAHIDERLSKGTALPYERIGQVNREDIIIYHLSTGHPLNEKVKELDGKLVIRYHNVTPSHFFKNYNYELYQSCKSGVQSVKELAKSADYVLADSEFNRQDLLEYGYTCEIEVVPILIPFADYEKEPNEKVLSTYQNDNYINILFTGRIAPNKKQEDLIDIFYYYKKYINSKSRLFLVGSHPKGDIYEKQLRDYVETLGLKDVVFTGQVGFDEILAYYKLADVFLCMSEHEGFCVPLVEAMYFDVPVVARNTTAIGDTLGGSGILLQDNEPIMAAEMINRVLTDEKLKECIIRNQRIRLKDFDYTVIEKQFLRAIDKIKELER